MELTIAQHRVRPWQILLLTLAWHLILFVIPWSDWFLTPKELELPPRVAVQDISQQKLNSIRQKWKKKALLLSKDKTKPKDAPKPKDARYLSDRNRVVEKEQRAAQTQVMPKNRPGTYQPLPPAQESAQQPAAPKTRVPQISEIGVPFNLKPQPQAPAQQVARVRRPPDGGDQALLERELPTGAENALNTEQSVYYSYYSRLYEQIGPVWQSLIRDASFAQTGLAPGDYTTQVNVIFDRNGNLLRIEYKKSSGVRIFDQAVEQSWRKIRRFPNPPKGLLNKQGQIHTGWVFNVFVSGKHVPDFRPPERVY